MYCKFFSITENEHLEQYSQLDYKLTIFNKIWHFSPFLDLSTSGNVFQNVVSQTTSPETGRRETTARGCLTRPTCSLTTPRGTYTLLGSSVERITRHPMAMWLMCSGNALWFHYFNRLVDTVTNGDTHNCILDGLRIWLIF